MKFFAVLTVMMTLLLAGSAMGFSWNYYDHGATPFDANNNTAPIEYPYGVGYLPSPGHIGEGGEKFDLEGLFVAFDTDYMYVALTNSYGMSSTSSSWGTTFRQGDIFFGFGGQQNTYAIDVSSGNLQSVTSWNYIQNQPGSYYKHIPVRWRVGAFEVSAGTILGSANQTMTFWDGLETNPLAPDATGGDTYVFEWKIDRNLIGWDGSSDIFFHSTLGCGNDLIEYSYPAIPEPSTMILLGLGLLGAGMIARRK